MLFGAKHRQPLKQRLARQGTHPHPGPYQTQRERHDTHEAVPISAIPCGPIESGVDVASINLTNAQGHIQDIFYDANELLLFQEHSATPEGSEQLKTAVAGAGVCLYREPLDSKIKQHNLGGVGSKTRSKCRAFQFQPKSQEWRPNKKEEWTCTAVR